MNDKENYRESAQNSTSVEHFEGQSYYEQAMEQAVDRRTVNPADIDARRIEGAQARAAAEREYLAIAAYAKVCGENIVVLRAEALKGEFTREDFDLAA